VCSFAPCPNIVTNTLTNEILNISPNERYSFIFRDTFNAAGSRGDAQILDQALTSSKLAKFVTGLEFARGNADAAEELVEDDGTLDDIELRASDHDGLVLYVCKDESVCDD
jgi:predicted extracellular nuclease